jgi:hypothetical protein
MIKGSSVSIVSVVKDSPKMIPFLLGETRFIFSAQALGLLEPLSTGEFFYCGVKEA